MPAKRCRRGWKRTATTQFGWFFLRAQPGDRVRFGKRLFTESGYDNDLVTIIAQNITMMQAGPFYRNRGVHAAVDFDGTSDPTPTVGDVADGDKIVFVCQSFAGTSCTLTVAGQTVTVDNPGVYEFTGTITAGAATVTGSGTFTDCTGHVFVGKEIV